MDKNAEWLRLGKIADRSINECWIEPRRWWHYTDAAGARHTIRLDRWLYSVKIGRLLPLTYDIRHDPACDPGCKNPFHAQAEVRSMPMPVRKFKLTVEQVQAIRSDPRRAPAVAAAYGVTADHVRKIRQGRRKQHVAPPDQLAAPIKDAAE